MSHQDGYPDAASSAGPEGGQKKHLFDDPANIRKALGVFFGVCVLVFLLENIFFVEYKHLNFEGDVFPFEGWFGFYSVYGFIACGSLVLISKILRMVAMRDEDYYER